MWEGEGEATTCKFEEWRWKWREWAKEECRNKKWNGTREESICAPWLLCNMMGRCKSVLIVGNGGEEEDHIEKKCDCWEKNCNR